MGPFSVYGDTLQTEECADDILTLVVDAFKEFIHKFLEVYLNDWTIFGLVKKHTASLQLMLDTFLWHQIALNVKKCTFLDPFRSLLGHVVCKQSIMVDLAKIVVILNLQVPRSVEQLHTTLGHTGYYQKFIKRYAQITESMEQLLKKDSTYCWNEECKKSLETLKEKMASAPILVFLKQDVEFHVHVDASCITLGAVLTQEGVEGIDHPIVFTSR